MLQQTIEPVQYVTRRMLNRSLKSMQLTLKRNLHRQRLSKMFTSRKILPKSALSSCTSQRLMLYLDMIQPSAPGSYILLPSCQRVLEKLYRVIDDEMQRVGCYKLSMPCMMDGKLYKSSGRWESTGTELIKLKDRHDQDYCLAPTHEEAITSMVASFDVSHKSLPLKYYQITRKFRDEMHPKNGLLRGREFEMKDLYTFDATVEDAKNTYELICQAYNSIFEKLKLNFIKAVADTGNIGGTMSHEYHIPAAIGEDTILVCHKCGLAVNKELEDSDKMQTLQQSCKGSNNCCDFTAVQGIEVGHTFLLGTKYSSVFDAVYNTKDNKRNIIQMGCYGIGVTRLLAASIEALSLEDEIRWPDKIAPYHVYIIPQKKGYKSDVTTSLAEQLYDLTNDLPNLKNEILLDDRTDMGIGKRLNEARRRGYPHIVAIGKQALNEEPQYEYMDVKAGSTEMLCLNELMDRLKQVNVD